MTDRTYDIERLKSLIHYVVSVAGARANFGAVKLNKVLWFSDARCFVLYGASITGAPYQRQKYGPIPRDGMAARDHLVAENAISQWRGTGGEWVFKALVKPSMNFMNGNEKAQVDYWIRHIDADHTAATISEESHDYGWDIAKIGENLPFHSVLAQRVRSPNSGEMEWAKSRAKELGLP
jgi:hypothetical protein